MVDNQRKLLDWANYH